MKSERKRYSRKDGKQKWKRTDLRRRSSSTGFKVRRMRNRLKFKRRLIELSKRRRRRNRGILSHLLRRSPERKLKKICLVLDLRERLMRR